MTQTSRRLCYSSRDHFTGSPLAKGELLRALHDPAFQWDRAATLEWEDLSSER